MPGGRGFVSQAQRRYMFSNHPDIAKRFASETPAGANLPEHSVVEAELETVRKPKALIAPPVRRAPPAFRRYYHT